MKKDFSDDMKRLSDSYKKMGTEPVESAAVDIFCLYKNTKNPSEICTIAMLTL